MRFFENHQKSENNPSVLLCGQATMLFLEACLFESFWTISGLFCFFQDSVQGRKLKKQVFIFKSTFDVVRENTLFAKKNYKNEDLRRTMARKKTYFSGN